MRLAVLGGSGRIGQHVLAWALAGGHQMIVLARSPESVSAAAGLTVVGGNATDGGAVAELVAGAVAVLSALGPRGANTSDLLATASQHVVAGMANAGIRRLICVSAAGAFIKGDPGSGALIKLILPRVLATTFADVRAMESVVASSDLDWTMVRATRLVDTPLTGQYRVRPDYPPPGGRKIARADVAHFMTAALTDGTWVRAHPALAY